MKGQDVIDFTGGYLGSLLLLPFHSRLPSFIAYDFFCIHSNFVCPFFFDFSNLIFCFFFCFILSTVFEKGPKKVLGLKGPVFLGLPV